MCGIAGFTHRQGEVQPHRILNALQSIIHRGPDEQDTYESRSVSLGSVRLKIVDLLGGQQPMMTQDRNTILVFNGEIYNHRELRKELEHAGYAFHSHSDTEVVLHAFEAWDTECFSRLRGMFAIALWIEDEKRLILARDRMGIKPLYVHHRGEDIYFGSELKTLFAFPEIDRKLDPAALEYYLHLNYVPGPYTLIQGIEKIRPGHYLDWKNGSAVTHAYWQCVMAPQEDLSQPEAEAELNKLLTESVQEHLVADVPVGVWLSGGVDSSTILHYANEVKTSRLKTFSISFAGRSFDERQYIREMVKRFGTEHYELDLNPTLDLSAAVEELSYYSDEPFADAGALPVWFLSAMTRRHAVVALSGEGADELFGGYVTYRADKLSGVLRRAPRFLIRGFNSLANFLPVSDDKISFEYKLRRFTEGTFLSADEAHVYWNGSFSSVQQTRLLHSPSGTKISQLYAHDSFKSLRSGSLNRFLTFDQQYYLPDDILQKVDRMSMAHSVEVRPPFLDHRLVEFTAKLPERFKIRGKCHKYLLKSLMRDKLPTSVLQRPKTGLDIPTHDWLRGPLQPLLMETLNPEAIKATGIFNPTAVASFVEDHMERRANLGFHLWGLLILFLWMKQWNIEVVAASESEHTALADFLTSI